MFEDVESAVLVIEQSNQNQVLSAIRFDLYKLWGLCIIHPQTNKQWIAYIRQHMIMLSQVNWSNYHDVLILPKTRHEYLEKLCYSYQNTVIIQNLV